MMSDTKFCGKCSQTLPTSEFHKCKSKRDGLRSNCKACVKAYTKTPEGKATIAKAVAKYRKTEKGKAVQAKARAKYQRTDKGKAVKAKYYKTEKGKAVAAADKHRRRARMKNNGGKLTKEQIREIQATPNKTCFWCEVDCNENYQLDHIVPISKGGRNSRCNIAVSCPTCNTKKGDKDLSEWLEEIDWYTSQD
jgi:5-methylcytosine-specific restriction endonuclease McrA